jgi:hypothetical protein
MISIYSLTQTYQKIDVHLQNVQREEALGIYGIHNVEFTQATINGTQGPLET